jgi:hypothetical protein
MHALQVLTKCNIFFKCARPGAPHLGGIGLVAVGRTAAHGDEGAVTAVAFSFFCDLSVAVMLLGKLPLVLGSGRWGLLVFRSQPLHPQQQEARGPFNPHVASMSSGGVGSGTGDAPRAGGGETFLTEPDIN